MNPLEQKRAGITFLLARLPIGMSFFGHGVIRLTKLDCFAEGMISSFSKTLLPLWLVRPFAWSLPFVELLLGILLLTGMLVSEASIAGVLLTVCLIFGSAFQEQWNSIAIQMFYGIYLAAIYRYARFNVYAFGSAGKST